MTKSIGGNVATEKAKTAYEPLWLVEFTDQGGTTYRYSTRAIAAADWDPAGNVYKDGLVKDRMGPIAMSLPDEFGLAPAGRWSFSVDNKEGTRFSNTISSDYFTNQPVTLSIVFDDGTPLTTADIVPMGKFYISDFEWNWNVVTFDCHDASVHKLKAADTTIIGWQVLPTGLRGCPLAPERELGKIIPITYGSVAWAEGRIWSWGKYRTRIYFNDATVTSIDDVGIYDEDFSDYVGWNTGAYPLHTTYSPRGEASIDLAAGGWKGMTETYPSKAFCAIHASGWAPHYAIDENSVTFAEVPLFKDNADLMEFRFKPLPFDDYNTVEVYAKLTTSEALYSSAFGEYSNSVIVISRSVSDQNEEWWTSSGWVILSSDKTYHDSIYGNDSPVDISPHYRRAAKTESYGSRFRHSIFVKKCQSGVLRMHEYYKKIRGHVTIDEETPIYGKVKGVPYGAWIDASGRSSGHAQGDLIETPPYIIEHSLRRLYGFDTSDVNTTSFDIAGNTTDGALKDFVCGGQIRDEIEDARQLYDAMLKQFASYMFFDAEGRATIKPYDPTAAAYGTTIGQSHIIRDTISYKKEPFDNVYSDFRIHYNWHSAAEEYRRIAYVTPNANNIYSNAIETKCSNASSRYNARNRLSLDAGFHRDFDTVRDLMLKYGSRYTERLTEITFQVPLNFIDLELADLVKIDHPIASGAGISNADKMMVKAINTLPDIDQIELTIIGPIPAIVGDTNSFTITYPGRPRAHQLYINNVYPIIWEWEGTMDYARLHYSNDNGGSWTAIESQTPNDGHYRWTVPAAAASVDAQLRISGTPDTSFENTVGLEILATSSAGAGITVYEPDSESRWLAGGTNVIRWVSGVGDVNVITAVDLDYYDGSDWHAIAADRSNMGYYPWHIPDHLAAGSSYKVKVTDSNNAAEYDESDQFKIYAHVDTPSSPSISSAQMWIRRWVDERDIEGEYVYEDEKLIVAFTDSDRDDSKFNGYQISVYLDTDDPEDGVFLPFNPKIASSYTFESYKVMQVLTDPATETYKVAVRAGNRTNKGIFYSNWATSAIDIVYLGGIRDGGWRADDTADELNQFAASRSLMLSGERSAGRAGGLEPLPEQELGDINIGTGDRKRKLRDIIDIDSTGELSIKKPDDLGGSTLLDIDNRTVADFMLIDGKADDLGTMYDDTDDYRQDNVPTNDPQPTGLSTTKNVDGSWDIDLTWSPYSQGAVRADGFMLFIKTNAAGGMSAPATIDPSVKVGAEVTAYTYPALAATKYFYFGIAPYKTTKSGPSLGAIQTSADWANVQPSTSWGVEFTAVLSTSDVFIKSKDDFYDINNTSDVYLKSADDFTDIDGTSDVYIKSKDSFADISGTSDIFLKSSDDFYDISGTSDVFLKTPDDLDDISDGATYGKVKGDELDTGQVKRVRDTVNARNVTGDQIFDKGYDDFYDINNTSDVYLKSADDFTDIDGTSDVYIKSKDSFADISGTSDIFLKSSDDFYDISGTSEVFLKDKDTFFDIDQTSVTSLKDDFVRSDIGDELNQFAAYRSLLLSGERDAGRAGGLEPPPEPEVSDIVLGTGDKRLKLSDVIDVNATADPFFKDVDSTAEVLIAAVAGAIESSENLASHVGIVTGGESRAIIRTTGGSVGQTARHGDSISFSPAFDSIPSMVFRPQCITYQPDSTQWSTPSSFSEDEPQYLEIDSKDLTTSGFDMRARLVQKGAQTLNTSDFQSGASRILDAVGESTAALLNPGGAASDIYHVHYKVYLVGENNDISPWSMDAVIAIDTKHNAESYVERATYEYTVSSEVTGKWNRTWPHEDKAITVSGLDANDYIRIRFKSLTKSPKTDDLTTDITCFNKNTDGDAEHGLTYYTATDITADATPHTADLVGWDAIEVS